MVFRSCLVTDRVGDLALTLVLDCGLKTEWRIKQERLPLSVAVLVIVAICLPD